MLRLRMAEHVEMSLHSEEAYPHECCGVLLGNAMDDERRVIAVARCRNTRHDSPHNRYSIDPAELVRVQRQAREEGLEIIGFYHSHPDHPARWSQTDLAEAHWTGCSYVITSVINGRATDTNSFNLAGDPGEKQNKYFEDEEIRVE